MSHQSMNHECACQAIPKNTTPQLKAAAVKLGPSCTAHTCPELGLRQTQGFVPVAL